MTNKVNTVLYTGFTNDLGRRVEEHQLMVSPGFTKRYKCVKLVYFEEHAEMEDALHRERQLKRYRRKWKEELIEGMNPTWADLSNEFTL